MKKKDIENKILDHILSNSKPGSVTDGYNQEEMELLQQYESIMEHSKNIRFPEFDAEKGLIKADYMIQKHNQKRTNIKFIFLKAAAVIILGLFIAILIHRQVSDKSDNQFIEIFVNKGEKLTIKLPDGNCVWLNSNSTIKYPSNFNGLNKRIEVTGEAYFDLRNNTNFPIVILASQNIINCSSAAFNVKSDDTKKQTEIIVEKGWLTVANSNIASDYEIKEGEKATLATYFPLAVEPGYSQNEVAWKTGKLIFDKTPMQTVASTLSDLYDINIKIEGELKYCEFSSKYYNKDIQTILNDIQLQFKPTIIEDKNQITIKGKNCK